MPHDQLDSIVPRVAVVGMAVQYRVVDAVKAAVNVLHLHALVDNRCQAAVGKCWTGMAQAKESVGMAYEELKPWLFEHYGVELERMDLTHHGLVVGVMQLSDESYNEAGNGGAG